MAGARLARNEGRTTTRRSLTSTLPADLAPASRAWMSDRPSWCVDMGSTLLAMTTCDLWLSLARNDVTPKTKVWREGMPYWEALEKVPEFSLAMPDANLWGTKPSAATSTSAPSPVGKAITMTSLEETAAAAAEPSAAGVITLVPPSDFATPAPVVVEHRASGDTAVPSKRRLFPRLDRRGALSVAFGAAVAIGALMIATTGPVSPRPASDAPAVHAAAQLAERAPAVDLTEIVRASAAHDSPGFAGDPRTTTTAPRAPITRPPRGPHAADRGQHRAR